MKRCYRCKNEKNESEFGIDRSRADGLMPACKSCRAEMSKAKYAQNRDLILEHGRAFYHANKEDISRRRKELKAQNPDRLRDWRKKHRSENKDKLNAYSRTYWNEVFKLKHKERLNKKWRDRERLLRLDVGYKIHRNFSSAIWRSVKGKKHGQWESITGYSVEELMAHIESLFSVGMSWDNYGEWHIDHKIPVVAFDFKSTSDGAFNRAWELSNLQPLWAFDNQSKSNIIGGVRVSRNSH